MQKFSSPSALAAMRAFIRPQISGSSLIRCWPRAATTFEHEARMIDPQITARCKTRLIAVARARETIIYSALAGVLGVANQSVGLYLNEIYADEIAQGHPDLTVVAVYDKTGMVRYNSRGGPAQSVPVDPNNAADVAAYQAELERVYNHWAV